MRPSIELCCCCVVLQPLMNANVLSSTCYISCHVLNNIIHCPAVSSWNGMSLLIHLFFFLCKGHLHWHSEPEGAFEDWKLNSHHRERNLFGRRGPNWAETALRKVHLNYGLHCPWNSVKVNWIIKWMLLPLLLSACQPKYWECIALF